MQTTTYTFRGYKASADYTCTCKECGKALKRTVTVEHTLNPYNKNDDGSVKTASEVLRGAYDAARIEAAKKQDVPDICRDCDERENRALLLSMADEPDKLFPEPARYWNSPMHFLSDRKQVDRVGHYLDDGKGGYAFDGWRINDKGLKRAAQLRAAEAKKIKA